MPDREARFDADAENVVLVLVPGVAVDDGQPIQRRPALAGGRHVLPLVLANDAARRRSVVRWKLRPAGSADEGVHRGTPRWPNIAAQVAAARLGLANLVTNLLRLTWFAIRAAAT